MECRQVFGTPAFRVDLVDPAIKFKPTIVSRGFHGLPFFSFPRPNKGGSFAQVKIVGPLFEVDFFPRNDEVRPLPYNIVQVFDIAALRYLGPSKYPIQYCTRHAYLREWHRDS